MIVWSQSAAYARILGVVRQQGIDLYTDRFTLDDHGNKVIFSKDKNGLRLTQHKNTWKRKRETGYLVCIEYFRDGERLLYHVEPWVSYPSDFLIAKLMLLPVKVKP